MLETIGGLGRYGTGPIRPLLILAALAIPAYSAQFQLGVLVQAGFAATGPELDAGNSSASPSVTGFATPYWTDGQDRRVELQYQKATNNLEVRLYQDGTSTSAYSKVDFNPTGGALVAANATWTLPAASFFVTAATGPILPSSITLSNITLTGISGALNILQPIQQTTLQASRGFFGPTTTITQTQDIVFRGDSTGSWMLTGTLNLTGFFGVFGASGNQLAFGFNGTANGAAVPEPSPVTLVGPALVALGLWIRRRKNLPR